MNFLELLRAGHTDCLLNDAAYAYVRKHSLAAPLVAGLMAQPQTSFPDRKAWLAHLEKLGFTKLDVTPEPVRVATEASLRGSVQSHGFLTDGVVLSDDAGQFNVGAHALCRVHAERLVQKLDTFTDAHRAAQAKLRGLIWGYYADLKAYRLKPRPRRAAALRKQFDRIFLGRTGFVTLDRLLKRLRANKAELLTALDRPQTPLHTNGSERDIRCYVTRRKVSAGTRSDAGRDCRDASLSLAKTWASSVSKCGTTSAAGSRSPGAFSSSRSMSTSGARSAPRDLGWRPRFCPPCNCSNYPADIVGTSLACPQASA